jgi:hypothetical protein
MIALAGHDATAERDLAGCPVTHPTEIIEPVENGSLRRKPIRRGQHAFASLVPGGLLALLPPSSSGRSTDSRSPYERAEAGPR